MFLKTFYEFDSIFAGENEFSEKEICPISLDVNKITSFNSGSKEDTTSILLDNGMCFLLNISYTDFKKILSKINKLNFN